MDWEQTYRQHYDRVFGIVYRRTYGNVELARDLAQDTFVRAMGNERQFRYDDGRGIGPWLTTIAVNLLNDHFKRHSTRRETPVADFFDDDLVPSAEDAVVRKLETARMLDQVARLVPLQRQAMLLTVADLPDAEIATVMGRNVGAVKTLKFRARQELLRRRRRDLLAVA